LPHSDLNSLNQLAYEPFLRRVSTGADKPAVISRERTLNYGELETLSRAWAHELRDRGTCRDTPVAIVMEKGWEQVVGVLAVLRSGAPYLPVDADLPAARLEWILNSAGVKIALTQSRLDRSLQWPDGIERLSLDLADQP
jgi:non-ribosomal peptide synthetase component F